MFVCVLNKRFYGGLLPAQKKVMDDCCNKEYASKVADAWRYAEDAGREKSIASGGAAGRG